MLLMALQPVLHHGAHTEDLIQAGSQKVHPTGVQNLTRGGKKLHVSIPPPDLTPSVCVVLWLLCGSFGWELCVSGRDWWAAKSMRKTNVTIIVNTEKSMTSGFKEVNQWAWASPCSCVHALTAAWEWSPAGSAGRFPRHTRQGRRWWWCALWCRSHPFDADSPWLRLVTWAAAPADIQEVMQKLKRSETACVRARASLAGRPQMTQWI